MMSYSNYKNRKTLQLKEVSFMGASFLCGLIRIPDFVQNLFLNKKYENLLAVDIICHGVPSPMVFEKYKEILKNKYNSNINNISFRDKGDQYDDWDKCNEFGNRTEDKSCNGRHAERMAAKKLVKA